MSTFPGKQPDPCKGQISLDEPIVSDQQHPCEGSEHHVYVCRIAVKDGEPAVTVARKACGTILARGSHVRLLGVWEVRQYPDPQPCGSTVVLETHNGFWRVID